MPRKRNDMVVLITGATGLIGTKICTELVKDGVEVRYFSRNPSSSVIPGAKGFQWNPNQFSFDKKAMDGVTHVINLAGATIAKRWSASYKKQILLSRLNSLKTLEMAIEESKSSSIRVLSASAIGVYKSDLNFTHDEHSTSYGDGFLTEVVQQWEAQAQRISDMGHALSLVRIGIVLDSDQGALPKLALPVRLGLGAPLGSGRQWQSWIHSEDLSCLFVYLLKNNLGPVVNAVAPHPVLQKELLREVANILKLPFFLPPIPDSVLKLFLGEMAAVVLESQKVRSELLVNSDFEFRFKQVRGALTQLLKR